MAKRRRTSDRSGWIIIDKPAGWTSHDVVAKVRRIVGERRAGHAGTLDPAATGVLPIAIGLATRTVEYLSGADKSYRAWVRFGVVTDTGDGDGEVISRGDASRLDMELLAPLLDAFRGEIRQRPPAHSAIRIDGARAYQRARRGEEIEMPERSVTIHDLTVVAWQPPILCIDVTCSKGTYIRSIARDLGQAAGSGAFLERLVRTRTGPFTLDAALSLDELAEALDRGEWSAVSQPSDAVLGHLSTITLVGNDETAWYQGKPIAVPLAGNASRTVRAYNAAGNWIGIGIADPMAMSVRPHKVIPAE